MCTRSWADPATEDVMIGVSKLCAAGIVCAALAAGTMAANANVGSGDVAPAARLGTVVALNPQPLPPRCLPPGCKSGGGGIRIRSATRRIKPGINGSPR